MRLFLVRHGQTDSNVARALDTGFPGAPLNEVGVGQAHALADQLASSGVRAVYSSDLTRAAQTAWPLAQQLGVTHKTMPGFREIFAGEHDMSTDWQPYVDVMIGWVDDPAAALPGAESFLDFEARWDAALAAVEDDGHDSVAVISHGAAMRIWVPYAATNATAGDAAGWPLPNTAIIVLEGSRSAGWTLTSWAGQPHG